MAVGPFIIIKSAVLHQTNPIFVKHVHLYLLPSMNVACKSAVDILDDLITFDKVHCLLSHTFPHVVTY